MGLIHRAVRWGEVPLKMVLRLGVCVDARDADGRTPLTIASASGLRSAVELLLSTGADVRARGPLEAAVVARHMDIVKLLLSRGADADAGNPLCDAARMGSLDIAEALLANGASVHKEGAVFGTPLHVAAYYGQVAIARLLLSHGAMVKGKNPQDSNTPLHWAVSPGSANSAEMVKLLIERGAKLNVKNTSGETPLYAAAFGAPAEIVLLLLPGSDVNVRNHHGWSPLMKAVSGNNMEVIRVLRESGARISKANMDDLRRIDRVTIEAMRLLNPAQPGTLILSFPRTQSVTQDLIHAAAQQVGFTDGRIAQTDGPATMSRDQAEAILARFDLIEGSKLLSCPFTQGTAEVLGVSFAYVKVSSQ